MKKELDLNNLPAHIAFIMDGNGRWAKKRGLPRNMGHKAGASALERLLSEAAKLGIKNITVYAFSTENRGRPPEEVKYLMGLMGDYIDDNLAKVKSNNYRIRVIGNRDMLEPGLADKIKDLEELTKDKTGLSFNIALYYGGRDEIVRAAKKLAVDILSGNEAAVNINEESFARYLDTKDMPDPDLIIRTSGEQRSSNFLIWQGAYSEIYFTPKLWPDFSIEDLKEAIMDYQSRERRFGKI